MSVLSHSHRYQKLCTLRTHDPSFSQEEVLFNHDRFTEIPMLAGELAQIVPVKQGVSSRDFSMGGKADEDEQAIYKKHILIESTGVFHQEADIATEPWRAYTFVVKDASKEVKDKDPNLRVSLPILNLFLS